MPTPLIVPTSTSGQGFTLLDYRSDLGETLGLYQHLMVTQLATGGEAARHVILDELRDDEQERSQWAGAYLYARDGVQAGQQRRILREGYEGQFGALRLSRPFAAALLAGTSVELSWPLPVKKHLTVKGLDDIVNEALERCRVEARLSMTGDGTSAFNLSQHPSILRYEDTNGLYDWRGRVVATDNAGLSPYAYDLRVNGHEIKLETSYLYTSGDTFELAIFSKAKYLVAQNNVWGYSNAGLVADDDQAAVPLHWVRAFGMVKALRHLDQLAMRDASLSDAARQAVLATHARDRQQWARACVSIIQHEFPLPMQAAPPSMALVGSVSTPSAFPSYPSGS
jgi:hypothetical protein